MNRRTFLKGAAALVAGCAPVPKVVEGFRGLDALPYFDVDRNGNLVLTAKNVPEAIDFHAHLGVSFLLAPDVDLQRHTSRPDYILDYDADHCPLDLESYVSTTATPGMIERMEKEFQSAFLKGSAKAQTHTVPNLLDEMDRVKVKRAVLLGLAPGLSSGENLVERWAAAIRGNDRFVLFGGVPPGAVDNLHAQLKLGIRGLKFHPSVQRCAPNDPAAMKLFEECDRLKLPVFFHSGKAAMGPPATRGFADLKNFLEPVASFPNLPFVFGHAGNRDWEQAIPIAKAHKNVWLELHGQGTTALRRILSETDPARLLFGSDWPWYPIAVSMAKILLVTEGDRKLRAMILRDNAERLLA